MSIGELYRDTSITGEFALAPFKASITQFGYSFSHWTDSENNSCSKMLGCIKRIVNFIFMLIATIVTAPLVPMGLMIKLAAQSCSRQGNSNQVAPPLPVQTPIHPSNLNVNPPVAGNSLVIGTQEDTREFISKAREGFVETIRSYPGDLSETGLMSEWRSFLTQLESGQQALDVACAYHRDHFNVTIRHQNLFESGAQVIVNAANTHLGGGRGIDGAIHTKGGASYAAGHRALQTHYNSQYTQGYAAIIGSGELKQKHNIDDVIVVAGPQGPIRTTQKENELYSCYYNSLVLGHYQNLERIAFPTISTGIFKFPKDKAAAITLRAINDFMDKYPHSTLKTISIHFLGNDPDAEFAHFQNALGNR
jgi:O-acetyl-ADP-ribose deacetylase (regulator of RNase III)